MSATKRPVTFLDIPEELLIKIMCDHNLVMSCSKVCRSLNAIIKNTPLLAYFVELALAGLKDGPQGGPCLTERVASLHQYKNAVDTSRIPYRLLRLLRSEDYTRAYYWMAGTIIFLNPRAGACFKVHRPASFFSGVVDKVWHIEARPEINFPPHGANIHLYISYTADVGQDLFIVTRPGGHCHNGVPDLEQTWPECHLLSISRGGASHPLAAQAKLAALLEGMHIYGTFRDNIELAGDLLVWTISYIASTSHYVFNWKTGECLWHGDAINNVPRLRCYLLDPSHLVEVIERKLFIYNIGANKHEEDHLVLELPRMRDSEYKIETGSTVHRASSLSDCSPAFEENPDLTVLVLTSHVLRSIHTIGRAVFIIPLSNLVDLAVRTERESTRSRKGPLVLPWTEWGPDNARVVLSLRSHAVVSSMGGPRVSVAAFVDPPEVHMGRTSDVYTLDVRPRGKGLSGRPFRERGGPESAVWVADYYGVEDSAIFEEPVQSAAPCRVTKQQITLRKRSRVVGTCPRLIHDGLFFLACRRD